MKLANPKKRTRLAVVEMLPDGSERYYRSINEAAREIDIRAEEIKAYIMLGIAIPTGSVLKLVPASSLGDKLLPIYPRQERVLGATSAHTFQCEDDVMAEMMKIVHRTGVTKGQMMHAAISLLVEEDAKIQAQ